MYTILCQIYSIKNFLTKNKIRKAITTFTKIGILKKKHILIFFLTLHRLCIRKRGEEGKKEGRGKKEEGRGKRKKETGKGKGCQYMALQVLCISTPSSLKQVTDD